MPDTRERTARTAPRTIKTDPRRRHFMGLHADGLPSDPLPEGRGAADTIA